MIDYDTFKDDLPEYRKNFTFYRDLVLEKVADEIYGYDRYGLEFGALALYAKEPIDFDICTELVRQTDSVFALDENLLLVVFKHVNAAQTLKAGQNFLHAYRNRYPQKQIFASVAPIVQEETAIDIGSRLFIVLEYALKKSLADTVVDMGQMRI